MLHKKLINPRSIVIVGGSDRLDHLGGSVLKNLIDQGFKGDLFVVNPKKDIVQGLRSYRDIENIPEVDLAIIAIPAQEIPDVIRVLTLKKETRGFIVYSAGFSELNETGAALEQEICDLINAVGGSLLGPNNIGMLNEHYAGVFTRPLPKLDPKGVDFISGSGATAVFTIEAALQIGLSFSALYTVGNSAQTGIEEILEYLDLSYVHGSSSRVKMLYIEGIKHPQKFLQHCLSLQQKGCEIVALKAGSSEEGTLAASSHTGALASSIIFVQALFNKAGIIRCKSRYELIHAAAILQVTLSKLTRFGIITHAGGPGVLLTDALCDNGLKVPGLSNRHKDKLSGLLYPGASVNNPIDILATGSAEQLAQVIDYCDQSIDEIDAMIIIFGSPGLGSVRKAYEVISEKIQKCRKPLFPVLPSVLNVRDDIRTFIEEGNLAFYDESLLGMSLSKVMQRTEPYPENISSDHPNKLRIRQLIDQNETGYLDPDTVFQLLKAAGIDTVQQTIAKTESQVLQAMERLQYPVVEKVIGVVHKTEEGGVILNVPNSGELLRNFKRLMQIKGSKGVIVQEMIYGKEVFLGTKSEPGYPPMIMCGAGGIYVEVLKDFTYALSPVSRQEAVSMIKGLSIYPILKGVRGEKSIDMKAFESTIDKLSKLVLLAPEIIEMDINPLMATSHGMIAVDARIRLQK